MSAHNTVPGVPGLLRVGSVVERRGITCVVYAVGDGRALALPGSGLGLLSGDECGDLDLVLDSLTSRFHAALWVRSTGAPDCIMRRGERAAYHLALEGHPMGAASVRKLRGLVLRLSEAA